MSTEKKKRTEIVGLLNKTRDQLSITGETTWIAILPGSVKDGDNWKSSGTVPFKVMFSQKGIKLFLTALDIHCLLSKLAENQEDVDTGIRIAAGLRKSKDEGLDRLLDAIQ